MNFQKTVANRLAFDILRNLLNSSGEGFDVLKKLTAIQKNQYLAVIEETILDYFDDFKIKTV
jgi:hypothetical protein